MTNFLDNLIKEDTKFLMEALQNDGKEIKTKVDALLYNFDEFIKTGNSSYLAVELAKSSNITESFKTNILNKKNLNRRILRKGVLVDITEANVPAVIEDFKIKHEKLSTSFVSGKNATLDNMSVTSNMEEEMPAPKYLPPRKRKFKAACLDVPKRSTRTRKKPRCSGNSELSNGILSDIMIQDTTITMIDVTGGDESDKEIRNIKKKGDLEGDLEDDDAERKLNSTKVISELSLNKSNHSEYVDTVSSLVTCTPSNKQNTPTLLANNETATGNCTFVIENNKIDKDEGSSQTEKFTSHTPPIEKKNQEVFSPYEKVSTKQKVKAFEKLNKMSRTTLIAHKTRAYRKINVEEQLEFSTKKKTVTPLMSKTVPKGHSKMKVNKFIPRQESTSSGNSLLITKPQSTFKASQAELREREKRRQEKEQEITKKHEALLLALTEDKKQKREEKQMKAQQQREMLKRERQKLVGLKYHKNKQALAEIEEKLPEQKGTEKGELVKKRDEEVKKRDDDVKKQGSKQKIAVREKPQFPVYLMTEAPLLPTEDCYDSDNDEQQQSKPTRLLEWTRESKLTKTQLVMLKIGEQIKNTFFCRQAHTPDLREMFNHIDPRELKRNSSAVWRKPPRYTFFLENSSVYFTEDEEEQ